MNSSQSGTTRRWHRYPVELRLKVSVFQNGKPTSVFGRSSSLSEGGMGAYIPCEIPLGTTIVVAFTLSGFPNEISITATVRNVEGFRYGLEFQRVSEDVRVRIVKSCSGSALPN